MSWGPADVMALVTLILQSGVIEAVVRAVELIFKNASAEEKKEAAMRALQADARPEAAPILSAAIDAVVAEYNEKGIFSHGV